MKKKLFDVSLYRDAIRQTRVFGLMSALVLILQVVLIPVGRVISIPEEALTRGGFPESVGFWSINPAAILLYCCIAPLMTLMLYRFLTKRNACDFYHSIPQTRICLFVSFLAAILTWAMVLLWGTTFLGVAIHACLPRYFNVDITGCLLYCALLTAAVLFVVGAVLLSVSLTGTAFTNLVVALMIIFGPRMLMFVLQQAVGSTLTIVNRNEYLTFLGNDWNLVTGGIFSVFTTNPHLILRSLLAGAYTAGIGLVYMAIACALFHRRRSEVAGQPAINDKVQMAIRLVPAAVFCLIPDVLIFIAMTQRAQMDALEVYGLGILYLIGVFIYFFYELLSTRKWRSMVRAVPGLALLLVVNLLLIFGMYGMQRSVLSFAPEAEEIDAVMLTGDKVYIYAPDSGSGYVQYPGYLSSRTSKLELTDPKVKKLVADRLKGSIAYDIYKEDSLATYEEATSIKNSEEIRIQTVGIRCGGKTVNRRLRMTTADINQLAEALLNSDGMQEIYMNLPDVNDRNLFLSCDGMDVSSADLNAIYEALKQDVAAMGFAKWYEYCTQGTYVSEYGTLYMRYRENGEMTGSAFPLTAQTPRAAQAYLEAQRRSQRKERLEEMADKLDQLASAMTGTKQDNLVFSYQECYLTLDTVGENSKDYYIDLSDVEQVAMLQELLAAQKDLEDSENGRFAQLYVGLEYYVTTDAEDVLEIGEGVDMDAGALDEAVEGYYDTVYLIVPEGFALEKLSATPIESLYQ